jgi:hypothetical protein
MPYLSLFSGSICDIATDPRLKVCKIDKCISCSSQLICAEGRLTYDARDHSDPYASALNCLNKGAEIAITRKEQNMIDVSCQFHSIDRELDVHVSFAFATTFGVCECL